MKRNLKMMVWDDEFPILKKKGTIEEIDKIFQDLKIKYKGGRR